MAGPVGRWLETFMCKQYADLFEAYGFKTLHSVCQLQPSAVQQMGIPAEHCDKILENVSVLRQSLVGPVVSNFSEQNYDHQLASHGQGNNCYSYHSPSSYPSPHQYGNPNGQINHNVSYQTGEGYPGAQPRYRTSNQDVYGQTMYNNHLHPNHGSWEEPMRLYNHSPRHVMGNSPPPHSPMMRSPPPLSPSSTMAIPSHYPHHVIMDQSSATHHHAWSSSQVMSPSMMNSSRGTPSPGMGHPSNLSSPSMPACSPARAKPFSPPPYSPHPPPAHQQTVGYDYPPSQASSPMGPTPNRHLPSPGSSHSPSDPLQSLQKMVLLDSQNAHGGAQQLTDASGSNSPAGCRPRLAPAECATGSPCPNSCDKPKGIVVSASSEASSSESTDSSSMSTAPSPLHPLSSVAAPTSDSESAQLCLEASEEDRKMAEICKPGGRDSRDKPAEAPRKADAKGKAGRCGAPKACADVKAKPRKVQDNCLDACSSLRPSLLRPVKEAASLTSVDVARPQPESGPKRPSGAKTRGEPSANPGVDSLLCPSKNLRKKQKSSRASPALTPKSLKQLGGVPGSKVNGDKLGNWNLELSPDVTFVARKVRGGEAVVGSFEIVNNCSQIQEAAAAAWKRKANSADVGDKTPSKAADDFRNCPAVKQESPRRSGRLHSFSSEVDSPSTSVSTVQSIGSSQSEQLVSRPEACPNATPLKPRESLNGKMSFADVGGSAAKTQAVSKPHCDSPPLENSVPSPRKRGRPLGSKNRPRDGGCEEPETKKGRKKKCSKECEAADADCRKQKPLLAAACENPAMRRSGAEAKLKGPFLHLESTTDRLVNVMVVNAQSRDEEGDPRASKKRGEGPRARSKVLAVGFNSTLSVNYDVFTKDKSWVCSLCHRGSHHKGLGDLFGPYFEENPCQRPTADGDGREDGAQDEDCGGLCPARRVREKRKRSELVEEFFKLTMAKKGKRVQVASKPLGPEVVCENPTAQKPGSRDVHHKPGSGCVAKAKEFWVHEDCIVWCHGVYLLGQRTVGIKEAVAAAAAVRCSKCFEGGATLGCLHKGCGEHYHYLCAIETGCVLEEEAFSLLCSKHKQGRISST